MIDKAYIVIDMQESFAAANKASTIASCSKLILEAKQNNNPILFVEYKWNGPTLKHLTSLVSDYHLKFFVEKEFDDGSREIEMQFYRCRTYPKELIVMGVNLDCCVLETASSLARKNKYSVSLVRSACNTDRAGGMDAIVEMKSLGVKII